MKIREITEAIVKEKASRKLCLSNRPNSSLGASNLSSCKSQGLRAREGKKKITVGDRRIKRAGKKIKGVEYGGPSLV